MENSIFFSSISTKIELERHFVQCSVRLHRMQKNERLHFLAQSTVDLACRLFLSGISSQLAMHNILA